MYSGNDVTVLMSVYNKTEPEEFEVALSSVTIKQTVKPKTSVIVVDGPISDNLKKVLESLPDNVTVATISKNLGLAHAMFEGMKLVETDLVLRMDADDIARPNRIQTQIEMFNKIDDLGISGGNIQEFFDTPGDRRVVRQMPLTDSEIRRFLKLRNPFNHPTVMFKADVVTKAGGYKKMPYFEDYYLWSRAALISSVSFANSPEILVDMRAGEDLYARRGGMKYFTTAKKLRKFMLHVGQINFFEYIYGVSANLIFTIVPVSVRKNLYALLLRKKAN